jgi:cytochrome c oxidase subunit II
VDGPQSALDPAGSAAERIAVLFWGMSAGAAAIWVAVVGLTVYAAYSGPRAGRARLLIVGGGVVFPTVVLGGLLAYGLALLPGFLAAAPEGALRIHITAEMWWWRVRYLPPGGAPVDLANELRLAAGAPVELELESHDVIHSLWIPPLGGKMDMIPGRKTRLALVPRRAGVFRGVCAEYCGESHAHMAFPVVVSEAGEHDAWLAEQALPARAPADRAAARGAELFLENGCGACHTVRGTAAAGVVGPDLTHVGSRLTVGAGLLDAADVRRFVAHTGALKPGVAMPSYGMLPDGDLDAIAAYLRGLQ